MPTEPRSRKQIRMDIADTGDFLNIGRKFRARQYRCNGCNGCSQAQGLQPFPT